MHRQSLALNCTTYMNYSPKYSTTSRTCKIRFYHLITTVKIKLMSATLTLLTKQKGRTLFVHHKGHGPSSDDDNDEDELPFLKLLSPTVLCRAKLSPFSNPWKVQTYGEKYASKPEKYQSSCLQSWQAIRLICQKQYIYNWCLLLTNFFQLRT